MTKPWATIARFVAVMAGLALIFVAYQAIRTLVVLDRVERDRDSWQRPGEIVRALDLKAGDSVVDFGSGAGYFTLRLAPVVGGHGRVIAVDIRRQSLAFLWIRSLLRRDRQIDVVLSQAQNPRLPSGPIDALLIVNTFHELRQRSDLIRRLSQPLKPGGRLVVADRRPRATTAISEDAHEIGHGVDPAVAEAEIREAGFELVSRDDSFIAWPGDDPWWLIVFRKPRS